MAISVATTVPEATFVPVGAGMVEPGAVVCVGAGGGLPGSAEVAVGFGGWPDPGVGVRVGNEGSKAQAL